MGENSKIEWTDATVNFWWGCTKVGPGCDHCYAEAFDKRVGGAHWGLNAPRRKIASAVALIHKLDNGYADWAADAICAVGNAKAFGLPVPNIGTTRRVFIQSMSDLFDLEVPLEWFAEAWRCIEICNRLDIQIVTKRVSAVAKRLAEIGCTKWPRHIGLMITVVNQDEADRDIPRLLALKEKFGIPWIGLSIEPMLGPIDLVAIPLVQPFKSIWWDTKTPGGRPPQASGLDWVIVGGESGPGARPMHPDWARSLRDQCAAAGVAFLFKQWGEWRPHDNDFPRNADRAGIIYPNGEFRPRGLGDPCGVGADMFRAGKAKAGRLLDGIEHNGMPSTVDVRLSEVGQ